MSVLLYVVVLFILYYYISVPVERYSYPCIFPKRAGIAVVHLYLRVLSGKRLFLAISPADCKRPRERSSAGVTSPHFSTSARQRAGVYRRPVSGSGSGNTCSWRYVLRSEIDPTSLVAVREASKGRKTCLFGNWLRPFGRDDATDVSRWLAGDTRLRSFRECGIQRQKGTKVRHVKTEGALRTSDDGCAVMWQKIGGDLTGTKARVSSSLTMY